MKDDAIIALYLERNEAAIHATAETYGRYCHRIAFNILYNEEDTEECVNDTYLGAWKSIPPHQPNRLSTFLGKITRNLALNRYKEYGTQKRGQGQVALALSELNDCIPSENTVEQTVEASLLEESINQFLRGQPEQKRNIFIRRYWYLYSISDIAQAYAMSESKVTSLLFRMRNDLKTHLEKEGITL